MTNFPGFLQCLKRALLDPSLCPLMPLFLGSEFWSCSSCCSSSGVFWDQAPRRLSRAPGSPQEPPGSVADGHLLWGLRGQSTGCPATLPTWLRVPLPLSSWTPTLSSCPWSFWTEQRTPGGLKLSPGPVFLLPLSRKSHTCSHPCPGAPQRVGPKQGKVFRLFGSQPLGPTQCSPAAAV